jgi:hypothetical protein
MRLAEAPGGLDDRFWIFLKDIRWSLAIELQVVSEAPDSTIGPMTCSGLQRRV